MIWLTWFKLHSVLTKFKFSHRCSFGPTYRSVIMLIYMARVVLIDAFWIRSLSGIFVRTWINKRTWLYSNYDLDKLHRYMWISWIWRHSLFLNNSIINFRQFSNTNFSTNTLTTCTNLFCCFNYTNCFVILNIIDPDLLLSLPYILQFNKTPKWRLFLWVDNPIHIHALNWYNLSLR